MILEWLLPLIPSGIGYIAGIIGIGSFLLAEKRNLLIARLVTDSLFAVHYFLIDAFYGSYLSIVYILGVALGLAKEKITRLIENVARVSLCGVAA